MNMAGGSTEEKTMLQAVTHPMLKIVATENFGRLPTTIVVAG
jgi:hypothetical protein